MTTLAAIAFDPGIRGILVTLVGVVVLGGAVYMLLASNTGIRLGFLLTLAALFGWLFSLGLFWWIYGIGLIGQDPSWNEIEVNFDRTTPVQTEQVASLPPHDELPDPVQLLAVYEAENPEIRDRIEFSEGEGWQPETLTDLVTLVPELKDQIDEEALGDWRVLPESDARRGETAAAADAALAENQVFGSNTSPASYTVKDVFLYGGKPTDEPETIEGERGMLGAAWNRVVSVFNPTNPTLYGAVTVQRNIDVEVPAGEAPPPPQIDERASTVTVVMERNLGYRRLVPALFTIFSGVLFFVFCWMLHTRDRHATEKRENWDPSADEPTNVPARV